MAAQDERDLHDMGGAIGPADDSNAPADVVEEPLDVDSGRVQPEVDPNAFAVDSLPDELRTGQWNQDETHSVIDTTGEVREIGEDTGAGG